MRGFLGILAVLIATTVVAVPGTARAVDTWTLSIDAFNGALSWGGTAGNRYLAGNSFSFSEIVGYDENGDPTRTYALPGGHTGIVSFTTLPGYASTRTPATGGVTGTLITTFPGGTIAVRETDGTTTTTLVEGMFDVDGVVATSVWNKILSTGKYNSANGLLGAFSAARLDSVLTSYFNIAPEASGSLQLNQWSIFKAASATSEALLVGSTSGGVLTVQDAPVPIPGALLLFAPGLLGLVVVRRRLRR